MKNRNQLKTKWLKLSFVLFFIFAINSVNAQTGCLCGGGTVHTATNLTSYSNTTLSIVNDVHVIGSVTLNHCNVSISAGKKIIVEPGGKLTIGRSWVHGCGCMWEGIEVKEGAELYVARASIIEDALFAIKTDIFTQTSEIEIKNSIINKCETGVNVAIAYPQGPVDMSGHVKLDKVIFTCRNINSSGIYGSLPAFNNLHSDYVLTPDLGFGINALQLTNNIDAVASKTVTLNGTRSIMGFFISGQIAGTISPFYGNDPSIFDNMDYGVFALISSINIQYANFMNIEGNNTPTMPAAPFGSGAAIYIYTRYLFQTSTATIAYCRINNTCRAMYIEGVVNTEVYSNLISSDNTYSNYNTTTKLPGQYGIYYQYSAPSVAAANAGANWHITTNTIRNYNIGVSVIRNTTVSNQPLLGGANDFNCNLIYGQDGNSHFCKVGFFMNDGVGANGGSPGSVPETTEEVEFHGNDILRCTQSAIELNNVSQHMYFRNSVLNTNGNTQNSAFIMPNYGPSGFTLRDNSGKAFTVLMNFCNNIRIDNCNIVGYWDNIPSTSYLTTGIAMLDSRAYILNNRISNNKNDMLFSGQCNPSTIKANRFRTATNAMYFENDAQIGNQGAAGSPSGNKFATSNLTWQTNVTNIASDPNTSSKFYYRTNMGGGYTERMSDPAQTVSGGAPGGFQYANGISLGLQLTTGNVLVPQLVTVCPGPSGGPQPGFDPLNLIAGGADSLNIIKKLILDSLPLQAFRNQKWWRNKVEAYKMIEKNPNYFMLDPVVNAFYNNNQNTSVGKLNQVYEYTASGQTLMAESVNNGLPVNDAIEDYNKAVNYIYLKSLNDSLYTSDSTDLNSLEIIANACPMEMGKVVYEARNMLMSIKRQVLEYNDSCGATGSANRSLPIKYKSNPALENYQAFVLFPNPNNGVFELKQKLGKNFNGTLSVMDVLGKKVFENTIIDQKSVLIDLTKENNFSGIYFVKLVNENNQLLYLGKVIVQ